MPYPFTQAKLDELTVKYKEVLAEADAQVYDRNETVYVSLVGDAEIWRYWPELSPDDIPEAIDYLNTVTSIKNTTPCNYVDDPAVGNGEIASGRWRQAFVKRITQGDVTKLVQCLRRGYATKLNWDECRVKSGRLLRDQPTLDPSGGDNTSEQEKYIEVYWPNCAPDRLQELATSMNADTFADPVIEGEKRTGTWSNLVVGTSVADDGGGIISLALGISHYRLDGFATWLTHRTEKIAYLWGYAKDDAQAVANAWKAKGRSCTFSYNRDQALIDIILRERDYSAVTVLSATSSWNCRYKMVTDYYFGVSDPTLYPITTTPVNGISYDRDLRDNGDGSWDIIVTARKVQYRDVPFQTSAIDSGATVFTRQQLGLTTQTPEPVTATDGVVINQRVEVKDDCSKDIITNKDTGTAKENVTQTKTPDSTVQITEKTVQVTPLSTEVTPTAGTVRRIINAVSNYFNRYTTTEMVDTGIPQTITNTIRTPSETIVITDKTVQSSEVSVPVLQAGVLKRIKNVWSKYFERWDTSEETETGIAQTTTSKVETGMEKSTTEEKTVQSAELPDPTPPTMVAPGKIENIVNRPSKYPERWDTKKKTDESKYVSEDEYIAAITERSTIYHKAEHHKTTPPDIELGTNDEVVVLHHDLDDYLTHNYTVMRRVNKFPISDADNLAGISWTIYGELRTISVQSEQAFERGSYYIEYIYVYQVEYIHTMKYFKTAREAAAWCCLTNEVELPEDPNAWNFTGLKTKHEENDQSHFEHTGENEWRAIRVIPTYSLRGTYQYWDPSML